MTQKCPLNGVSRLAGEHLVIGWCGLVLDNDRHTLAVLSKAARNLVAHPPTIGRARRLKLVLKRMSDAELRELERINRLDEIRTWELSRSTENEYDVTIHCDGERPGPATPSDPGNQRR